MKRKKRINYKKETKPQVKSKVAVLSITIIIIVGFGVYSNSLNGKFIWDDDALIKNNIYIKSWTNLSKLFMEDIGAGAAREFNFYRPLQIFTYMLDYSIWKLNVFGYHLTNVMLHILVGLCIYWLAYILFEDFLLSFLASIFFVVHPIHTEAVSYISGRADPLALLFMFLCLILYIRNRFYFLMLLCYVLALSSKENSLISPLLILLYHYSFKRKLEIKRFLPILAITSAYILLRLTVLSSLLPNISTSTSLFQRLPGFFVAITNYLRLLFMPLDLHMEYGNKLFSFTEPKVIAGVLISSLFIGYSLIKKKDNKLFFLSTLWFFISLLPNSNLYPINAYMAEHWLYVPSIGFFLVLSDRLCFIFRTNELRTVAIVLTVGFLVLYSYLTIEQNNYWKEPITFYERTLKYAPNSAMMLSRLGTEYSASGKREEAIKLFEKAIRIDPTYAYAYNNIGVEYNTMGKREEAIELFEKAIEISPNFVDAYYNLGVIYNTMGKKEEAAELFEETIKISPNYLYAYYNLAIIYISTAKYEEAIKMYEKVIKINPNHAETYNNLGNVYNTIGKHKAATELYKKAIKIKPNDAMAHYNLAMTYYKLKQYDLSIKYCDKAFKLGYKVNPEFLELLKPHRK